VLQYKCATQGTINSVAAAGIQIIVTGNNLLQLAMMNAQKVKAINHTLS
jgi:hypothetical protein